MKCSACETAIHGEYYINPLFGESACSNCFEVLNHCCQWCGRFRRVSTAHGMEICHECRRTLVTTNRDIGHLVAITLPIVERHIGPNEYHRLPVTFGDMTPSPHAPQPVGMAVFGGVDPHILIQKGMPLGRAIGVLAHEYGHMILNLDHHTLANRPGIGSRELVVEEGFCEVMCAVALLTQSSDDARWMSFLMPGNPDPVYGEGFRMMWPRALELGSVGALLQQLTGEPHPYRGPAPGDTLDDFVIPDDIAPLVEASSGDRDKGVLRGTALLVKDLPADAPVGPRLRGRGLATSRKDSKVPAPTTKGALRGTGIPVPETGGMGSIPGKGTLRGKGLDRK